MRTFDVNLAAPGRLMLAAGLVGFGLVSLLFDHALDGLEPFELQPPAVWLNSGVLLAGGVAANRWRVVAGEGGGGGV